MFKQNKLQIFSFRKVKGYGLASAVIASMFLMQGVVSADVVTTPDGTKTTLSNDKASVTVDANHFKDSNDKNAKELYDGKEYEADKVTTGKDTVTNESKTVVSFETEDGTKLKDDVTKTATEEKELNYKV
jgi:Gram-positive signal peptide protein, YSIRK family